MGIIVPFSEGVAPGTCGRRLGWWLSIGTIFATWFGAETCMGASGRAFGQGILGVISDPFGAGLCLLISGFFFARIFRRMNIETIVDFFEIRFGGCVAGTLTWLHYVEAWMIALMIGALLSAIMSSADSAILTVLSLLLALYYQRICDLCLEAWGILLVGVAAPMIFGVYWKRTSATGALASAIAGTGSWIAFRVFLPEGHPCNLYGVAVSIVVLILVSLIAPASRAEASPAAA